VVRAAVRPTGKAYNKEQWEERRHEFLPDNSDTAYVRNLMVRVMEAGGVANWIAKPTQGIRGLPFEFVYVRSCY